MEQGGGSLFDGVERHTWEEDEKEDEEEDEEDEGGDKVVGGLSRRCIKEEQGDKRALLETMFITHSYLGTH